MKVHDTVLTILMTLTPSGESGEPREVFRHTSEPMSLKSCNNRAQKARIEIASGGDSAIGIVVFCDKVKVRQEVQ